MSMDYVIRTSLGHKALIPRINMDSKTHSILNQPENTYIDTYIYKYIYIYIYIYAILHKLSRLHLYIYLHNYVTIIIKD